MSDKKMMPILQVGDVLVSPDIITEKFCCDLDACKGICCVEGDAGAPVSMDEIAAIEDVRRFHVGRPTALEERRLDGLA